MDAIHIRSPREAEYAMIHALVAACPPLEPAPVFVYRIVLRYLRGTCLVAERGGEMIGWVLGLRGQVDPGVFFLWEIAVHPDARGLGLGRQLLAGAERLAREAGCRRVECTIRPTNDASRLLFEGLGYENVSAGAGPAEMREGHAAVRDFYEPGEAYMVYAKRLTGRGRPQRAQALRYTRSRRSVQR